MAIVYKDINAFVKKPSISGSEKLPVSDTEYITPEQIVSGVEEEIGNIVITRINLLYGASKTSGYVYRHSNGTIDPASSASIYNDGIPVVAGEKLYYKNLYPYFCGIKKTSDNSWVAMSENSVWNASGEYEVPYDGLLYISINNSAPDHQLLTRDKSMYDDDIIESYYGINPELLTSVTDRISALETEMGDVSTILASI